MTLREKEKVEFASSPRAISEGTAKSVENMVDYRKDKLALRTAQVKIITAGLVFGVIFIIFSGYLSKQYIGKTEEQRLSNLKQIVQLARNSIEPILVEYRSKQISKAQALEQVRNLVRRMVYKDHLGKNYVFMSSYDGTMLVQPFESRREMTNMWNLRDAYGVYIIRDLIKTAKSKNGSGYVSYYYKRPNQTKPEEKISFVIGIPEMNCYIGTGKYMTDIRKAERTYIISIASLTFLLLALLAILVLSSMREVRRQNLRLQQENEALKQAEEALRESEDRYRTLVNNLPVAVYRNTPGPEGKFLMANPAFCKMFGYNSEEEIKKVSPADLYANPEERQQYSDNLIEKGLIKNDERTLLKRDGTPVHTSITSRIVYGKDGEVSSFDSIMLDITDQRRIEEALRESEEKFRLISEQSLLAIGIIQDGRIKYGNEIYSKIIGYSLEEIYGWEPYGYARTVHKDDLTFVMRQSRKKQAGDVDVITNYQFKGFTKEKEIVWWDLYSRTITYRGRPADLFTFVDITEKVKSEKDRVALQAQLHRAQKMEAMGLLAGGVAHDLNNILSGIVSYPELLLLDLPEDSPLRKPIKTIQESGMRAADVVADLMTIARGVANSKEVLNLNTMVEGYLESAEYQKLENTHPFVNFKMELAPGLLNMSGSPIHIKKILMNLVNNASEAIEGAGTVTISSMNRYLDEPLKGYEDVHTGEYAVLSVSDDGSGIAPKDLEKIFEPFYTKKVMGRTGTGLGLAVVWNTVQDHNGYINVKSSKKETTFELYFPVTRKEVSDEKEKIPLENYLGHGEKILVVDDEERQREIACGMLTKLGYNTESVSSGEEAIEYVKEHPVDLIVLDMVMPKGINGRKTYEEIIKIRPGQKAIIASGYAKTKKVDIAQRLGAGKYIKKPYILEKIGLAVKEELEK